MNKRMLKSAAVLTLVAVATPLATAVSAATVGPYSSTANVEFVKGTSPGTVNPTDPTLPLNPGPGPVNPPVGTNGLSIDFASNLYFGQQQVTAKTAFAHAQQSLDASNQPDGKTVPNFVQVTDVRGTFAGWNLSVNTDSTLHLTTVNPATTPEASDTTLGDYLTGATITFNGGYLASSNYSTAGAPTGVASLTLNNSPQNLMTAQSNQGVGTWIYGMGAGKSGQDASILAANNAAYQENGGASLAQTDVSTKSPITLNIPASTNAKAAAYTTNLIWTLSDTPTNQ